MHPRPKPPSHPKGVGGSRTELNASRLPLWDPHRTLFSLLSIVPPPPPQIPKHKSHSLSAMPLPQRGGCTPTLHPGTAVGCDALCQPLPMPALSSAGRRAPAAFKPRLDSALAACQPHLHQPAHVESALHRSVGHFAEGGGGGGCRPLPFLSFPPIVRVGVAVGWVMPQLCGSLPSSGGLGGR